MGVPQNDVAWGASLARNPPENGKPQRGSHSNREHSSSPSADIDSVPASGLSAPHTHPNSLPPATTLGKSPEYRGRPKAQRGSELVKGHTAKKWVKIQRYFCVAHKGPRVVAWVTDPLTPASGPSAGCLPRKETQRARSQASGLPENKWVIPQGNQACSGHWTISLLLQF